MIQINVNTEKQYIVHVGKNLSEQLIATASNYENVVILCAAALAPVATKISTSLPEHIKSAVFQLPDGEEAKSLATAASCWDFLATSKISRTDLIVGIGGGAVTDLVGFVAATWLRGTAAVLVPTTVLGMVDAAVGGKCGINTEFGKNLVGSFSDPVAVFCDTDLLSTLDLAEVKSGFAEIIKCGFIADPEILNIVELAGKDILNTDSNSFLDVAVRAIKVKANVVSDDQFERSQIDVGRAALNYGHTLGHAIEKQGNYTWRHGDAVSIGMIFAAELAYELKMISEDLLKRHYSILNLIGLPTSYQAANLVELLPIMAIDKKATSKILRFVLLSELAVPVFVSNPEATTLATAFDRLVSEG